MPELVMECADSVITQQPHSAIKADEHAYMHKLWTMQMVGFESFDSTPSICIGYK